MPIVLKKQLESVNNNSILTYDLEMGQCGRGEYGKK